MIFYEASFTGVIRIILWILVISFIIRLIARLALPVVIKKAEQNMRQRAEEFRRQHDAQRPEGDVKIVNKETKNNNKNSDGEYVDYIEIKD